MIVVVCVIIGFLIFGCQTKKQWSKKGFNRGWVDTATVRIYDTVRLEGSTKDTLFMSSKDTIVLSDKNFITKYYYDTITKNNYLKTIVNNRDTIVVREIHNTSFKATQYSFADHLKAVWYVWLGLFVLVVVIALISILKK